MVRMFRQAATMSSSDEGGWLFKSTYALAGGGVIVVLGVGSVEVDGEAVLALAGFWVLLPNILLFLPFLSFSSLSFFSFLSVFFLGGTATMPVENP